MTIADLFVMGALVICMPFIWKIIKPLSLGLLYVIKFPFEVLVDVCRDVREAINDVQKRRRK